MTTRGFFGIGIYHTKTETNIGTLWRSAYIFGASYIFTVGKRYKKQSSDTLKTWRKIPLYHYDLFDGFNKNRPYDCQLVGVEQDNNSKSIVTFNHPERAIYLLGAEDHGLPVDILKQCNSVIHIDTFTCLNVAVAGSIVMYDRELKDKYKIMEK